MTRKPSEISDLELKTADVVRAVDEPNGVSAYLLIAPAKMTPRGDAPQSSVSLYVELDSKDAESVRTFVRRLRTARGASAEMAEVIAAQQIAWVRDVRPGSQG